jgi:hypothetical protein
MRSTDGVIGWRDVGEESVAIASPTLKQKDEGLIRNSTGPTGQIENGTAPDGDY